MFWFGIDKKIGAPKFRVNVPARNQLFSATNHENQRLHRLLLEGIPAAPGGDYTVRLKMPDGYWIAPHWHPRRENVTVILGTFKVGMGEITLTKARWQISQPAVLRISIPTCRLILS